MTLVIVFPAGLADSLDANRPLHFPLYELFKQIHIDTKSSFWRRVQQWAQNGGRESEFGNEISTFREGRLWGFSGSDNLVALEQETSKI